MNKLGEWGTEGLVEGRAALAHLLESRPLPALGVCWNADCLMSGQYNGYQLVKDLARHWPQALTYEDEPHPYFIPGTYHSTPLWEGINLERRIEFINWAIEYLDAEITRREDACI